MSATEPNISKLKAGPIIVLIIVTAIEFIAAAVIYFRLLPFLQADTILLGRKGNPVPTEQFVFWAVPVLIVMGCLSIFCLVFLIIDKRK